MSRSNCTYRTETALNVSQDYETPARSSSAPLEVLRLAVKEDSVLVEDSLGTKGAVPAAGEEIVEDSVENGVMRAGKAQPKRPSQQTEDEYDELYALTPERPREKAVRKPARVTQPAETQRKGSMNAVDALLARGATVHKTKQTPAEVRQAPIANEVEPENSQHGTSATVEAPASKKPAVVAKKAPAKAHTASNATGSLAALRMRRGQDSTGAGNTPKPSGPGNVLQPRDVNAQTPAVASNAGSSGKLKPVKANMFARTPVTAGINGAQKAARSKPQDKPTSKSSDGQSNIAVAPAQKPTAKPAAKTSTAKPAAGAEAMKTKKGPAPVPLSTQKLSEKQNSLKRPAKDANDAGGEDKSMYDVPQSEGEGDEGEDEYRSAKKARREKAPQPKRKAAKSPARGSPGPVKKATRKSKGKAAKPSSEPGAHDAPTPAAPATSTRARMKAVSGVAANVSKPKVDAKAVKQQVDGDESRDVSDADAMDIDASDAAIVPKNRSSRQRLETPAAIRSSPPVAGGTSKRATTAGLIDPASARKPTVISFDKSGPRNQGTSAQRDRSTVREVSAVQTDDDGFANVDDVGDQLVVDDEQPVSNQAVNLVRSARTISQQQMPPPKAKEKPRIVNVAPVVPSMVQAEVADSRSGHSVPPETKGSQRPFKRQKSQGTVDIHGSPVPDGMVVGGLSTVLETFSQQAGLSSDKIVTDGKANGRTTEKDSSERLPTKAHRAPARLSSNTKPIPAEPSQESQAITHVARVPKAEHFVQGHAAHPPTDPFTSSAEEKERTGKGSSSSAFSEHLRQQVARAKEAAKVIQAQRQDEQEDDELGEEDEEEEDPEKTLVEEDEDEPPTPGYRHPKSKSKSKPQRLASFSSDSSATSTSSTDFPSSDTDLGKWRLALQPYQLNLFDSLVHIAHRLTNHLAEREEAERDIVDDYRRRGKELVASLKAGRGKDVEGYVREVGERKRGLGHEMEGMGGKVGEGVEGVKGVRRNVKGRGKERGNAKDEEAGEGMREVMEAYC